MLRLLFIRLVALTLLLPFLGACANVEGSAVATAGARAPAAESTPVRVSALRAPDGAQQVGIVQARGTGSLQDLVGEFVHQVRTVGGNYGKVDSIRTKYEMQTRTETYTYSCGGTPQAPAMCTGTRIVTVEVATTQVLGRAFRVEAL